MGDYCSNFTTYRDDESDDEINTKLFLFFLNQIKKPFTLIIMFQHPFYCIYMQSSKVHELGLLRDLWGTSCSTTYIIKNIEQLGTCGGRDRLLWKRK